MTRHHKSQHIIATMTQDKLIQSEDSPMNYKPVASPKPTAIPEQASVAEASEYSEFLAPNLASPSEITRAPTIAGAVKN